MKDPILFYDGVCHFCNASVQFVLKHEREPRLRFMALQSPLARKMLEGHNIEADDLSSMLVLYQGKLLRESDAAIYLSRDLRQPWRFLGGLLVFIPKFLRDRAYRAVGSRRYQWWGRSDVCIPVPAESRHRFPELNS